MLVNSPIDVSPFAGDFHIRFINKPAATNRVATRPSRVNQQRREALHPPLDGDVINLDTAFGEQLFNITVREPISQIPAHRQQDHIRGNPETNKRRTIKRFDH